MATANPNVTVNILGNAAGLNNTLQQVQSNVASTTKEIKDSSKSAEGANFSGLIGQLGTLVAAYLSVSAVLGGFKGALDAGGELNDLSARTGIVIEELMVMRRAFADAGVGAEKVGPAINMMQKNLSGVTEAGDKSEDVLNKLGLSLDGIQGMSAGDQFKTIGGAIAALPNQTDRAGVAMKLFGKSGAEMLGMFSDSDAMESAAGSVGGQAAILAQNAAKFDAASDIFGHVGEKVQGLFVGILGQVIDPLLSLLKMMDTIDLSGIGTQIGQMIGTLLNVFQSGQFGELISLSLTVGFSEGLNYMFRGLDGLGAGIAAMLEGSFGLVADPAFWLDLFTAFAGLGELMTGVAMVFGAKLENFVLTAVAPLYEWLIAAAIQMGSLLYTGFQKAGSYLQEAMIYAAIKMLDMVKGIGKWIGVDLEPTINTLKESKKEVESNRASASGPVSFAEAKATAHGLVNFAKDVTTAVAEAGKVKIASSVDHLKEGGAGLGDKLASVGSKMAAAAAAGFAGGEDFVDASKEKAKMGQIWDTNRPLPTEEKSKDKKGDIATVATGIESVGDSLTSIGGGGGFSGGDALLSENERHTGLLEKIAANTGLVTGGLQTGALQTGSLSTSVGVSDLFSPLIAGISGPDGANGGAHVAILSSHTSILQQIANNTSSKGEGKSGGFSLTKA